MTLTNEPKAEYGREGLKSAFNRMYFDAKEGKDLRQSIIDYPDLHEYLNAIEHYCNLARPLMLHFDIGANKILFKTGGRDFEGVIGFGHINEFNFSFGELIEKKLNFSQTSVEKFIDALGKTQPGDKSKGALVLSSECNTDTYSVMWMRRLDGTYQTTIKRINKIIQHSQKVEALVMEILDAINKLNVIKDIDSYERGVEKIRDILGDNPDKSYQDSIKEADAQRRSWLHRRMIANLSGQGGGDTSENDGDEFQGNEIFDAKKHVNILYKLSSDLYGRVVSVLDLVKTNSVYKDKFFKFEQDKQSGSGSVISEDLFESGGELKSSIISIIDFLKHAAIIGIVSIDGASVYQVTGENFGKYPSLQSLLENNFSDFEGTSSLSSLLSSASSEFVYGSVQISNRGYYINARPGEMEGSFQSTLTPVHEDDFEEVDINELICAIHGIKSKLGNTFPFLELVLSDDCTVSEFFVSHDYSISQIKYSLRRLNGILSNDRNDIIQFSLLEIRDIISNRVRMEKRLDVEFSVRILPGVIRLHPYAMDIIFDRLINNSAEHGATKVMIETFTVPKGEMKMLRILYTDNGYGMNKSQLDKINHTFFGVRYNPNLTTRTEGHGLGSIEIKKSADSGGLSHIYAKSTEREVEGIPVSLRRLRRMSLKGEITKQGGVEISIEIPMHDHKEKT